MNRKNYLAMTILIATMVYNHVAMAEYYIYLDSKNECDQYCANLTKWSCETATCYYPNSDGEDIKAPCIWKNEGFCSI